MTKVDHLARLLETPEPTEILRLQIDSFVAELGDELPVMLVAKELIVKAVNMALSQESASFTSSMLSWVAAMLAGRWGPSSIRDFIEMKNY